MPRNPAIFDSLESRLLMAARPSYNTGTGFFVSGSKVYDANGQEFVMKGYSQSASWGNSINNWATFAETVKTGANSTRLVMSNFGASYNAASRAAVVERIVAEGIVPIVEDHDTTNKKDVATFNKVVDRWLEAGNVAWLKKYEKAVILNIANEWGPVSTVWRDAYVNAIKRIRAAGIKAMVMVDAAGFGQDIYSIKSWAKDIQAADPQHNVVFSIHMYGFWRTSGAKDLGKWNATTGAPWDIKSELTKVLGSGIPLIVGEFSWNGSKSVLYNTREAMQTFKDLNIGWIAWGWNQNVDPKFDMMVHTNDWEYKTDANLSEFGKLVIKDPTLGLKATAKPASIFSQSTIGSIWGTSFTDTDKNGAFTSVDLRRQTSKVFIDANNNGKLDTGEKTSVTDPAGQFLFTDLPAGTYRVRTTHLAGYSYSTPLLDIVLSAGQRVGGFLIGSKQGTGGPTPPTPTTKGTISGFVFGDNNKNGVFDAGELKGSGRTVFIDLDGDNLLDTNEVKLVTDSNGAFSFTGLSAGTFKIRRVIPTGYKVTTPARNITLATGQVVSGVTIGSATI